MRKSIGMLSMMAMASMMAGGANMPQIIDDRPKIRIGKRKLGNYKHIGPIPKGCKLITQPLQFEKNGYVFTIDVDIVFASKKTMMRKSVKYEKQINDFITNTQLYDLLKIQELNPVKIEENKEERK